MADSQLVGLLENMLLAPDSDFYISTILFNPDGSSLDPRTIPEVDFGTINVDGLTIGVVVKNLVLQGLSNCQIKFDQNNQPEITVDGSSVTFHGKQPNTQAGYTRPPSVPNQIQAKGELDINLAGTQMPPGTISITVQTVDDLSGTFTATEARPGQLDSATVTFTALQVNPTIGGGNILIQVTLQTQFQGTINQILNQAGNLQKMVDALNAKISSPDILASLSNAATKQAQAALAADT